MQKEGGEVLLKLKL